MKAPSVGVQYDHLLLARRHPLEEARFVAFVQRELAGTRQGLGVLSIEHEADGSCCRVEPWPATFARLATRAGGRQ
jgi:hypothetical protein